MAETLNAFRAYALNVIARHGQPVDDATLIAHAESAGYDAAANGSNTTNCHFSHFGTPERMAAWERGNERGKRERQSSRPSGV